MKGSRSWIEVALLEAKGRNYPQGGAITMQTVLRVRFDNRGQGKMVDDYRACFCAKAASNPRLMRFPSPNGADVAFERDDAQERNESCAKQPRALLGSFNRSSNPGDSKIVFIFVDPIILSFRR